MVAQRTKENQNRRTAGLVESTARRGATLARIPAGTDQGRITVVEQKCRRHANRRPSNFDSP